MREETFQKLEPKGKIQHVPYEYHNRLRFLSTDFISGIYDSLKEWDGIIYAVAQDYTGMAKIFKKKIYFESETEEIENESNGN